MRITYQNLTAEGLRGETLAHYLVDIEADFRLLDGQRVVYGEPCFPVIELARALHTWAESQRVADFVFDSMSFEEPGAVVIVRSAAGWVFGSRLTPEVTSDTVSWQEVQEGVNEFVASVRSDLMGLGIDPAQIFPDRK